jgi:hypothetical protein
MSANQPADHSLPIGVAGSMSSGVGADLQMPDSVDRQALPIAAGVAVWWWRIRPAVPFGDRWVPVRADL